MIASPNLALMVRDMNDRLTKLEQRQQLGWVGKLFGKRD